MVARTKRFLMFSFFSNTWKDLKTHYQIMSYLVNKEKFAITIVVMKSGHVLILGHVLRKNLFVIYSTITFMNSVNV